MTRPARLALALALGAVVSPSAAQDPVRPQFLDALRPWPGESAVPQGPMLGETAEPTGPFLDTVASDRDAYTPTPWTAGRGRVIVEGGYSFLNQPGVRETNSFPEMLVRVGVLQRLELRFGWNYEMGGVGNEISAAGQGTRLFPPPPTPLPAGAVDPGLSARISRESWVTYGAKFVIAEQAECVPDMAIIVVGQTPTGADVTQTNVIATYVAGWALPDEGRIDVALRYMAATADEDHYNVWSPSAVLPLPLGQFCGFHMEYFGLFSQGKVGRVQNHYLSTGFNFLLTHDLELGIRGGGGINDEAIHFFGNAGFGYRF